MANPTSLTNLKKTKKTRTWKLEPCSPGFRCWCCCCDRVARIRRHRLHTLVCKTSADIPLETTAFHISKHYKLVDFTATSSSSSHSSWAFWFGFQSSTSSIHPHEELAKFSKTLENSTYLHAGARICLLLVSQRERENKGLGAWFFCVKDTNLLKNRAKGREE
jgi:hypothetical protein